MFSKRIVRFIEVVLNWNLGIRRKMLDYLLLIGESKGFVFERSF